MGPSLSPLIKKMKDKDGGGFLPKQGVLYHPLEGGKGKVRVAEGVIAKDGGSKKGLFCAGEKARGLPAKRSS